MNLMVILLGLIALKLAVFLILEWINFQFLKKHSVDLPFSVQGIMDEATFAKSVSYTQAKSKFSVLSSIYDGILLILILTYGVIPLIYEFLSALIGQGLWAQSLVFILSVFLFNLPSMPLNWWHNFKLEHAFGFNKSTQKLWFMDQIKGFILSVCIGVPLIFLLMWIVEQMGSYWWLWAFAVFWLFQVIMVIVYPMFILPLFNKLEPLESGELKDRLMALGDRCGFKSKTIFVMDGSKRSGHSNAFFTGFGQFRRIVLYDTLIEQMDVEELEAVLAHEIGHYKCGHIPQRLIFSALSSFILFFFLGWLMQAQWVFDSFAFSGSTENVFVPSFLLLTLFGGLFTFWFSPFEGLWSRQHEYQADAFARKAIGGAKPLISALRKLYNENLGNLIPHPLYSAFYYSHPTLVERESALQDEA